MIIYLTDEEKKAFKERKYTERDIWQVEKGLNDVVIKNEQTGRRVSNAKVMKEIGREAYIGRVDRAAFHFSSMYEDKYLFDLSAWFK